MNYVFRAYSIMEMEPIKGLVRLCFYCSSRKTPILPYQLMIRGYDRMDREEKLYARIYANEFLTSSEVEELSEFLARRYGTDVAINEFNSDSALEYPDDYDDEKLHAFLSRTHPQYKITTRRVSLPLKADSAGIGIVPIGGTFTIGEAAYTLQNGHYDVYREKGYNLSVPIVGYWDVRDLPESARTVRVQSPGRDELKCP